MPVLGLEHVQISVTPRGEEQARAFYGGLLEMPEIEKPPSLAGRGGVWFGCGSQQLHCGVEDPIAASRRHPGLLVSDLSGLATRLSASGFPIYSEPEIPGYRRLFTEDPFGNRLELMERS